MNRLLRAWRDARLTRAQARIDALAAERDTERQLRDQVSDRYLDQLDETQAWRAMYLAHVKACSGCSNCLAQTSIGEIPA